MKSTLHHSGTPAKAQYSDIFPLSHPEWDDMRVPVTAVRSQAGREPTWTDYKGGVLAVFGDKIAIQEQAVTFVAQLPHGYKEGTDIETHIHWVGEDNTAGNVAWTFTHSWANIDGIFPTETTVNAVATNNTSALDVHTYTDIGTFNGAGKTVSSMLICSLRRNSSNASDTYNGKDALLLEIDFHFQMNTIGSQQEHSKN